MGSMCSSTAESEAQLMSKSSKQPTAQAARRASLLKPIARRSEMQRRGSKLDHEFLIEQRAKLRRQNVNGVQVDKRRVSHAALKPLRASSVAQEEKTTKMLVKALSRNFLCEHLSKEEVLMIVDYLKRVSFKKGENIIVEGDLGDFMLILESGKCLVHKGGEKLNVVKPGETFGEVAVLYQSPRNATVTAVKPCVCWRITRDTFRHAIAACSSEKNESIMTALAKVDILKPLSRDQLSKVADAVTFVSIKAGGKIIKKGSVGSAFYMVQSGTVSVTEFDGSQGDESEVTLGPGSYFGEASLIHEEKRNANVTAKTEVNLLGMDKASFEECLGGVEYVLERNATIRTLRTVAVLKALDDGQLRRVATHMGQRVLKEGEHVFKQGDPGFEFFIIKKGKAAVQITKPELDNELHTVNTLSIGDYFGELALLGDGARSASVMAQSELILWTLDGREFKKSFGDLKALEEKQNSVVRDRKRAEGYKMTDFHEIAIVGEGALGRVRLIKHKITGHRYALKAMLRRKIIEKKCEAHVVEERRIMLMLTHPFALKLIRTFRDETNLYIMCEFVQGGELMHLITHTYAYNVPLEAAQFYAASLIMVLGHMHDRRVVYRDLKPENVLIHESGFVRLADMGFAKELTKGKTFTLVGTPVYLAPEMVTGAGQTFAVDWWAIGVLIYEMIAGQTPFESFDQVQVLSNIVRKAPSLPSADFDKPSRNLIKRLLDKKASRRLGSKDGDIELRMDPWFGGKDGVQWGALERQQVEPPWKPALSGELDVSNFQPNITQDLFDPYFKDSDDWCDMF